MMPNNSVRTVVVPETISELMSDRPKLCPEKTLVVFDRGGVGKELRAAARGGQPKRGDDHPVERDDAVEDDQAHADVRHDYPNRSLPLRFGWASASTSA